MSAERKLPESAICMAAVALLRSQGWKVSCEVPCGCRNVDAAGHKDGAVLVMEAKVGFTKDLRYQLSSAGVHADFIIAAIGKRPKPEAIEWCRLKGFGILLVEGGIVTELLQPTQQELCIPYCKAELLSRIDRYSDATIGGAPNLKGVGPAQQCQRLVDAYKAQHPNATWQEVFENVPSHYDSAKNMYSALRSNRERMAFREKMKARKLAGVTP